MKVQKQLRGGIWKGKDRYRKKLEEHLQQNNMRGVWRGLKTISYELYYPNGIKTYALVLLFKKARQMVNTKKIVTLLLHTKLVEQT